MKHVKTFTFEVYYECDVKQFKKLMSENNVKYYSLWEAPRFNYWGEELPTFNRYIFTYLHTHGIEMEVKT